MLTDEKQNIDLVYNQRTMTIHFVIGETITGSAPLDSSLLTGQWLRLRVVLDAATQTASFYCNDKPAGSGRMSFGKGACCRIFFGAIKHEGFQTLDVPPMRLRDVRLLENGTIERFYPLNESSGQEARDAEQGPAARATNPVWIKPRHQQWENRLTLETTGTPSVAYNERDDLLYIVTDDTLFTYSFRNGALRADAASRATASCRRVTSPFTTRSATRSLISISTKKRPLCWNPGPVAGPTPFTPPSSQNGGRRISSIRRSTATSISLAVTDSCIIKTAFSATTCAITAGIPFHLTEMPFHPATLRAWGSTPRETRRSSSAGTEATRATRP